MNKTLVRIICGVLGFLMIGGTMALITSGLITACENAKAQKEAEENAKSTAAIVYNIEEL